MQDLEENVKQEAQNRQSGVRLMLILHWNSVEPQSRIVLHNFCDISLHKGRSWNSVEPQSRIVLHNFCDISLHEGRSSGSK